MTVGTISYGALPAALQDKFKKLDPTPRGKKLSVADQQKLTSAQKGALTKLIKTLTPDQLKLIGIEPAGRPQVDTSKPIKVKVDGLASLPKGITNPVSWATLDQAMLRNQAYTPGENATRRSNGAYSAGFIDVGVKPTADGFRVVVDSHHQNKDEGLNLFLQAEAYDPAKKQLRVMTFAVLAKDMVLNKGSYEGHAEYDVSLTKLNAYLKKQGSKLKVTAGTPLFVTAQWAKSGHRGGGPGAGRFVVPQPGNASSPVATQINAMSTADADVHPDDIPLDIQVAYPDKLINDQDWSARILKRGGHIVSRLESEYKGATKNEKQMAAAVDKAYELWKAIQGGDKKAAEKIFGKNWTIEAKSRHWLKDDGAAATADSAPGKGPLKGFRVNPETGWPLTDPMDDVYADTKNLDYTSIGAVERLRKNDQKAGVYNVKDPGVLDPKTGIRQRVEIGMEFDNTATLDKVHKALAKLNKPRGQWRDTVFNHAARHMAEVAPKIDLSADKVDTFHIVQERHKFELKNVKTGVSVELSFDFVDVDTMRPEHANSSGKPKHRRFAIFEGELNHLQLNSDNEVEAGGYTKDQAAFKTDDKQVAWLKKAGKDTTLNIEPKLHGLSDVKSGLFRQSTSYKVFEDVNGKAVDYFFPKGLTVASQKANYAAHLFGLAKLAT